TGASGTIYAQQLILDLLSLSHDIDLMISSAGLFVAAEELDWQIPEDESEASRYFNEMFRNLAVKQNESIVDKLGRVNYYRYDHISAPPASGSYFSDGMIIIPCSMGAASSVASGKSDNLLERTADVALKEHRRMVMVPRESPMHAIHLRNLLTLAELGVYIVPACPSFYQHPRTIDDLVEYFSLRVLDQLGIHLESDQRWT
ncbi:MAG TPA: UbiX family flavin prenyltransferase, partial [Oscillospiraceae bacterium]|nr:UbiX family flavin prenyltransferase [Oscillospiraceae bacterium]